MIGKRVCPICGGSDVYEFLRRNAVPVHQNLVRTSVQDALQVTRGDLALTICPGCGFVFNNAFDMGKLEYSEDYDNTQSHSPFFMDYMADLAKHLLDEERVNNNRIIEIGCGKGIFLRMLVGDSARGNSGIGFDPSYVGPESDLGERLSFNRCFYDEGCSNIQADVVVCRHVIEHIPQPLELLRTIRLALNNVHAPRIYFETPSVAWILRNQVIWDFFYEHCSLFTVASLRTAFERTGFVVEKVHHVFGGQYLWLEATLSNKSGNIYTDAGDIPELCRRFAIAEEQLQIKWRTTIMQLAAVGKVAVWGAGAKGTTFVNLIDPERNLIDCVVDLNPKKQGKFVPGTGHPIVGVETLATLGVRSAILMNPNYRRENEGLLVEAGIAIQLIE
jgi:SAM-dependent methyltransferase